MFTLADDKMIGEKLRELILTRYHTIRDFILACLEERGESATEVNRNRRANQLSQIFKGRKQIQILDLKLYANVLNVSPEYILSAGQEQGPKRRRLTNASVAKSLMPAVWRNYLQTPTEQDVDEYGKTLVEYAVEYKNCELIHYLVDTGHIIYWGDTEAGRQIHGLGAILDCWGISEEQEGFVQLPKRMTRGNAAFRLEDDPALREGLMRLAIEANDVRLLQEMHARKTQEQTDTCNGWMPVETGEVDHSLVDAIAAAEDEVIAYFAEEYTIKDNYQKHERWLSPFFTPLLHSLLEKNHPLAEQMLKTAAEHNQYACDYLSRLFAGDQKSFIKSLFGNEEGRQFIRKEILQTRKFNEAGDTVLYTDARNMDRLSTNLVRVDTTVVPETMKSQADDVNDLYQKVHALQPIVTQAQEV